MPTSRKRIGFLPNKEVQDIIDKICLKNNLSQSKVTGILVEEALNARNLYQIKRNDFLKDIDKTNIIKSTRNDEEHNLILNKNQDLTNDQEYKLIKDYINYKKFKRIISKVELDS